MKRRKTAFPLTRTGPLSFPAPYEICPEDYAVSMVWRRTPSGELAFNRCPPNATGTDTSQTPHLLFPPVLAFLPSPSGGWSCATLLHSHTGVEVSKGWTLSPPGPRSQFLFLFFFFFNRPDNSSDHKMKYIFILTPVANSTLLQLKCILRALTCPPSRGAPSVRGAHGGRVCEKRCGRKERQGMFFRVAEALMCVQREGKKRRSNGGCTLSNGGKVLRFHSEKNMVVGGWGWGGGYEL